MTTGNTPIKTSGQTGKVRGNNKGIDIMDPIKKPMAAHLDNLLKDAEASGKDFDSKRKALPPKTAFQAGKPKQRKLTILEAFAERIGPEYEGKIFNALLEKASAGDPGALKIYFDRRYPIGKVSKRMYIDIKELITLADVEEAKHTIIKETASGDIPIDEAQDLLNMIREHGPTHNPTVDPLTLHDFKDIEAAIKDTINQMHCGLIKSDNGLKMITALQVVYNFRAEGMDEAYSELEDIKK